MHIASVVVDETIETLTDAQAGYELGDIEAKAHSLHRIIGSAYVASNEASLMAGRAENHLTTITPAILKRLAEEDTEDE